MTNVWNNFQIFISCVFVPSLRPLLEILGVQLVLDHPAEIKKWRSEGSENLRWLSYIQLFKYFFINIFTTATTNITVC